MLLHNETVRKALDEIKALDETTTQETLTLCQIPAPSHQEKEKAECVMKLFREICKENGIMSNPDACFSYLHEFPEKYEQMSLFDIF